MVAVTEEAPPSTRDRILITAATMISENTAARLSVRAVAARAGVSTGSLRHFFPTQQSLIDEVAAGLARLVATDERIHDRSVPVEERLAVSLQQLLKRIGIGAQARQLWRTTVENYVLEEPSAEASATFLALDDAGRRKIEGWLRSLTEEGAIAPGDDEQDARFLSTLLDGLAIARALPTDPARIAAEISTVRLAAEAITARRVTRPGAHEVNAPADDDA